MITRKEFDVLIEVLKSRCKLVCTTDHATNIMTYDQWAEDILKEVNE